jgi:hypothetical protein
MTTDERSIKSNASLKTELKALLAQAYDSGLNVEGGWECRNGPEHPDWDVIITEVEKLDDSR